MFNFVTDAIFPSIVSCALMEFFRKTTNSRRILPHFFCCIINLGLLKVGVPQPWERSKKNLSYIRKAGVRQFISTYNRVKDLKGDVLLFGDEIEYGVFVIDPANKKIRLSLRAKEVSLTICSSPQKLLLWNCTCKVQECMKRLETM